MMQNKKGLRFIEKKILALKQMTTFKAFEYKQHKVIIRKYDVFLSS